MQCSPELLYFSEDTGRAPDTGALKQERWDHPRSGSKPGGKELTGSTCSLGTCRKEWSSLFIANSSPFSQSLNTTGSFLNQENFKGAGPPKMCEWVGAEEILSGCHQ